VSARVAIVVTSHARLGETGKPTGFWLEELAAPYLVLSRAGHELTLTSPQGGRPPADPKSEKGPSAETLEFLADAQATDKLQHTVRLDALQGDFDAVFVAGGHGVMWDLAQDEALAGLLSRTWARGGVVAAVCHGPAGLVRARKADGSPLVAGLRVTGFSNEEEIAAELHEVVPFLLEDELARLGGRYERGPSWKSFAIRDGRLVTGQNPASSTRAAELVVEALSA
jgi:putative intracellular protease/amidase